MTIGAPPAPTASHFASSSTALISSGAAIAGGSIGGAAFVSTPNGRRSSSGVAPVYSPTTHAMPPSYPSSALSFSAPPGRMGLSGVLDFVGDGCGNGRDEGSAAFAGKGSDEVSKPSSAATSRMMGGGGRRRGGPGTVLFGLALMIAATGMGLLPLDALAEGIGSADRDVGGGGDGGAAASAEVVRAVDGPGRVVDGYGSPSDAETLSSVGRAAGVSVVEVNAADSDLTEGAVEVDDPAEFSTTVVADDERVAPSVAIKDDASSDSVMPSLVMDDGDVPSKAVEMGAMPSEDGAGQEGVIASTDKGVEVLEGTLVNEFDARTADTDTSKEAKLDSNQDDASKSASDEKGGKEVSFKHFDYQTAADELFADDDAVAKPNVGGGKAADSSANEPDPIIEKLSFKLFDARKASDGVQGR